MKILNEFDTIQYMLDHKCGLSRAGDGELKLVYGRHAISQVPDPKLQRKFREILKAPSEKCLVGIPRIFERKDWPTEKKANFWRKYADSKYTRLYDKSKLYGSSPQSSISKEPISLSIVLIFKFIPRC